MHSCLCCSSVKVERDIVARGKILVPNTNKLNQMYNRFDYDKVLWLAMIKVGCKSPIQISTVSVRYWNWGIISIKQCVWFTLWTMKLDHGRWQISMVLLDGPTSMDRFMRKSFDNAFGPLHRCKPNVDREEWPCTKMLMCWFKNIYMPQKGNLFKKKGLIILLSSSSFPLYVFLILFNNISLPWALAFFYHITCFASLITIPVGTCFWGLDNWIVTLDGSLLTRWTTNIITWITILNTLVEMFRLAHNVFGNLSRISFLFCLILMLLACKDILLKQIYIYICWHTCFIFILKCAKNWLGSLRVVRNYGKREMVGQEFPPKRRLFKAIWCTKWTIMKMPHVGFYLEAEFLYPRVWSCPRNSTSGELLHEKNVVMLQPCHFLIQA